MDDWGEDQRRQNEIHNQKGDGTMNETSTRLYGYPVIGTGRIVVEFDESGWNIIEDTRSEGSIGGYLHIGQNEDGDISADAVTDQVRDSIIRYSYYINSIAFNNPKNLPGIGASPQTQYMSGLSIAEREEIGNKGQRAFYA
jgi:hypothetical protein